MPSLKAFRSQRCVETTKDGNRATRREWAPGCKLVLEAHSRYGQSQDLPDGTAAWREWTREGILVLEEHYQEGGLQDLPDGTAARRSWNPDGTLKWASHYQQGVRQ